ncbi:hypothetical protein DPEC_G00083880 [Dallia pectoralis]|uniref:Uncharacterized protein n=1 Tax=Dallia pectoralis TaxID=75939 RepID=A0ACC2GZ37_DALPE|nr:hypothetical protein DPEC_G00083880 [Dallia pectoralis]
MKGTRNVKFSCTLPTTIKKSPEILKSYLSMQAPRPCGDSAAVSRVLKVARGAAAETVSDCLRIGPEQVVVQLLNMESIWVAYADRAEAKFQLISSGSWSIMEQQPGLLLCLDMYLDKAERAAVEANG